MNTASRHLVHAAAFVALAGCTSNEPTQPGDPASESIVDVGIGQPFQLRPGTTAQLPGGLLVGFKGVSSDSRCPSDVVCVWQGDASVRINATVGRMAWTPFDLHTGINPKDASFRDWQIRLVAVNPHPRSTAPIPPGDYTITLEVTRH
ncbi:MAG: hypothetical protein ACREMA_03785 [Longimicrobiales bacterium]